MVAREERDFVALTKREADIAEERLTFVVDLGQSVDVKGSDHRSRAQR